MHQSKLGFRAAGGRFVLLFVLAAHGLAAWAGGSPAPSIQSIQLNGKNVLVTVSVPAGFSKVTLESRSRLAVGAWVPKIVTLQGGVATNVAFTIPLGPNSEMLRVRGDFTTPLPASFYQGTNNFTGPASTSDPSTSSGVDTLAPGVAGATTTATASTTTPVVESDIWQFAGNTLFFFNQRRGLQVIDISQPNAPVLRHTLPLPAVGQQMYLLDTNHVVLLTQDYCGNGTENDVLVVQLTDQELAVQGRVAIQGSWSDSRMVGNILYLAAQNYYQSPGSNGVWQWGTVVSSIDLGNPANPVLASSQTVDGYGDLVYASDDYFFVVTQDNYDSYYDYYKSVVHPFDISAGTGQMTALPRIDLLGQVQSKYNLNYDNGIFSAIYSSPTSSNWDVWETELQNFTPGTGKAFSSEGSLFLASGGWLQSTRFDGARAYIVTGDQTSPLYVVDNSNPANPVVAGAVKISGWSSFIVPLGNQLVTIGAQSNLVSVSLFDVSQPSQPALLNSVVLGDEYSWSFANWDDKSFNVLPGAGLILVPYEGYGTNGYSAQVQLIDLNTNSLKLRGIISHPMQPERTAVLGNVILALSETDLLSVDASDRDQPLVTGDAELAWDVSVVIPEGNFVVQVSENDPGAPTLRTTSAADTSTILSELVLTNFPVLGVASQGRYAYIAQGPTPYYFMLVPVYFGGNYYWGWTNGFPLVLSVIDLSNPANLQLAGQTIITNAAQSWGVGLTPLWVKTNLLVWAGNRPRFFPMAGGPILQAGVAGTASPAGTTSPAGAASPAGAGTPGFFYSWWGGGNLTAFDVSNPAAPAFASQVQLSTNGWSFSQSYTVGDLVYSSYENSVMITNAPASTTNSAGSKGASPPSPDQPWWIEENYLAVVDYTDPLNPTPRPPANIPSPLAGVSPDGSIVYTEGPHLNALNYFDWSQSYLDASAYDGVSAHLIDSIPFSPNWPDAWLVSGTNVLISRSGYSYTSTNVTPNAIELWNLSPAGKFVLQSSLQPDQPIYGLLGLDSGLVVGQGNYSSLFVFDLSKAPALNLLLETKLDSCLWFNLSGTAGSRSGGLWVPFGYYGVEQVTLP
jgi:hypothetical protein